MIDVSYHRGVHLPDLDLWLDPVDAKPCAFVSHAHSDHIGRHDEIVTSAGTAQLMRARLAGKRIEHVLPFGKSIPFRNAQLTLYPAGHIIGSAQIFLETENGSLLYSGDFKLRQGLSAEAAESHPAETLIMETTYGLPRYRMPPTDEVIRQIIAFCEEALDEKAVPVLLGYSLGKAQEILCALTHAGLTPMLHGAVYKMTEIYRQLRPDFPCNFERYQAGEVEGKVLICPPSAINSVMVKRIRNRRTAVLTGWALDAGAKYRYQCDAAFPLTDHADYPDLIRYVELVQPRRVLTLHGFAAEFAADLRARGIDAWALSAINQLELGLGARGSGSVANKEEVRAETGSIDASALDPCSFHAFAALGALISATTSKLRKIELLSEYLSKLDHASLPFAAVYLTGRAFPQSDPRVLNTGWAIIKRALLSASGVGEARLRESASRHSDAGKTAYEILLHRTAPRPFTLLGSQEFFDALQRASGPHLKTELLQQRLSNVTALEGSYIVRILTGDLRIGLKEGLVEEAVAHAFHTSAASIREANMVLGDIGEVAVLAQKGAMDQVSVRLFRPIKCMLASPEPSAEAVWSRLTGEEESPTEVGRQFWVEDKFDGIRAQMHIGNGRVEIFSRDLRNIAHQFGDLVRAGRHLSQSAIFDGEIIAFESGRKLTFFDLQKRLGRTTEDDLFLDAGGIPVIYQVFDLLWLDGVSLIKEPLSRRRELLDSLALAKEILRAPIYRVDSPEGIEQAFQAARSRSNEGLIAKDASSFYSPGRRGSAWVKLKKELATLDVVVVGAETGHGKRSHVLSDYTFAVRDESSGALLTIGKAYSGLTDEEIEDLTEHFKSTTVTNHGRYREVIPEVVLEVAFDSVQPSDRHASGLALRFPRIKAIRRDKSVDDIDTLAVARNLVA